jgi:hypothetical protein
MGVIGTFGGTIGTLFHPELTEEDDVRLKAVLAVAEMLDAVIFTPSALRDAHGWVLYGATPADDDAEAVWPRVMLEVRTSDPVWKEIHERILPTAPGDSGPVEDAPSAERVATRALALAVLTARAMLEGELEAERAPEVYEDLQEWARDSGAEAEMEPYEREILLAPLGGLDPQVHVDAVWRLEGLVVLAWALGRFELPPHDRVVEAPPLWSRMGVLDGETTREVLASPTLRPREEIATLRNRLFTLHWRLREHFIRPRAMDFAKFAETCGFGPLDLGGLTLVDGDLGVNGMPIDRASGDDLSTTVSIARERHHAANWLWEGPVLYSDASEDT